MTCEIEYTEQFVSAFKKLSQQQQKRLTETVKKLSTDPDHPGLRRHKFKGLRDCWTIRSGRSDRLVILQIHQTRFRLLDVGPHDAVYRRLNRS
ncbi:mRNA-degrading endonuclease RelE, toxin component of the RelBE toxin-antitoxin system [Cohaesibacter sp. ES.047]|nr:mRNA-degrading endonuclease RelE, toxin component of the RelBE toxin-antitoxin system [Cohaesibacter sp. ES.047]SNY94043.1 mRNA-degrading endonuclease RelE, toxin component of the RelBE toxin-antitoxin system [Cohaesibacter sp. ES.047]